MSAYTLEESVACGAPVRAWLRGEWREISCTFLTRHPSGKCPQHRDLDAPCGCHGPSTAGGIVQEGEWCMIHDPDSMDIHTYFGLTYANYLVLPRTLLQSMPWEWQVRFVALLQALEETMREVPQATEYRVNVVGNEGRFAKDPVPHYNRGRTHVGPVPPEETRHPLG